MITKERLEELLEENSTIYTTYGGYVSEINLDFLSDYIEGNYLFEANLVAQEINHIQYTFNILFETKEDAKFASKYQNISRIDYLNLPTYEEFIKNYQSFGDDLIPDEKCVIFTCKDGVYSLYACDNEIWVGKDTDGSVMFHKELNRDNYIEACDICVKLFKGEM